MSLYSREAEPQIWENSLNSEISADIADDDQNIETHDVEAVKLAGHNENQSQKTVLTEDYLDSYTDIN